MEPQHDHHCLVCAGATDWRIRAVKLPVLHLVCPKGCCRGEVEITGMNFEVYAAEALLLDYAAAAREARDSIPAAPFSRMAH